MKKRGFTLIELLVVISIIALLLAILMPSLAKVKEMARTLICQTNVRSCSTYIVIYMEENGGYFIDNHNQIPLEYNWKTIMHYLWKDSPEIFMCPTTSPDKERPFFAGQLNYAVYKNGEYKNKQANGYYDSYGLNFWINNPVEIGNPDFYPSYFWRNKDKTRFPNAVPMLGDHNECSNGAWPSTDNRLNNLSDSDGTPEAASPPQNEQDPWDLNGITGDTQTIREFCIDRHSGYNVMGFMDGTARKVGLKEMWTLRWAKSDGFDIQNKYTIAGNNGDSAECARIWDGAAKWMSQYKEY